VRIDRLPHRRVEAIHTQGVEEAAQAPLAGSDTRLGGVRHGAAVPADQRLGTLRPDRDHGIQILHREHPGRSSVEQQLHQRGLEERMVTGQHERAARVDLSEPVGEPGERAEIPCGLTRDTHSRRGPGADDDDFVNEGSHDLEHPLEQGRAAEHRPRLVAAEPTGSPTPQHDRCHSVGAPRGVVAARGIHRATCSIAAMAEDDFDSAWIDRFAAEAGLTTLDDEQIEALLALAGRAAHESGDRRNAPLSCFLRGLQLGRTGTGDPLGGI
jgi:Domain of unknown function (DUF6457)